MHIAWPVHRRERRQMVGTGLNGELLLKWILSKYEYMVLYWI